MKVVCPWDRVDADALGMALPWRTFRWHHGQRHYPGSYWSATVRDLVIYESRLELTRLLYADHDRSVRHIVAQPFLLKAEVSGAVRRHIPDYLLLTDRGPVVVDVKPRHRMLGQSTVFTFGWTRRTVESKGWRYEVWNEPPPMELENVRFLAGFRRDWLFDPSLLALLRAADLDGATLAQAYRFPTGHLRSRVRSAVLHLLWCQHFVVDFDRPLSLASVLRRPT